MLISPYQIIPQSCEYIQSERIKHILESIRASSRVALLLYVADMVRTI